MDDDGTTLILTRPADRSEDFLSLCEARMGRRLPSIISPVIEITPHGDLPNLDLYQTVILTSASAVSRLGDEKYLSGRKVVTVGERTAQLARELGAHANCLGEDIESFLASDVPIETPALHCRGVHARGNLAERLSKRGVETDEAVIYDQVQRPLNAAARAVLAGKGRVILPLFSPRSAKLVSQSRAASADTIIIAMSRAVADEWQGGGDVRIAQEPTSAAMVDRVIEAF